MAAALFVSTRESAPSGQQIHTNQRQLSDTANAFLSLDAVQSHDLITNLSVEAVAADTGPVDSRSEEVSTNTPLRRSSRPRRSVSPFIASSPRSRTPLSPAPEGVPQIPNLVGPARRKSVKGKQRAVNEAGTLEDTPGTDSGAAGNIAASLLAGSGASEYLAVTIPILPPEPDAHPEKASGSLDTSAPGAHGSADATRDGPPIEQEARASDALNIRPTKDDTQLTRLEPLSPTSHGLVAELLAATLAQRSAHGPPGALPEDLGGLDANDSRVQRSTPPNAPPTPYHATEDAQSPPPSTPPRDVPSTPAPLHTPARRIPIGQAVAQGTVSPQKGGSRFLSQHGGPFAGVVGTPIFRPRVPGDAGRTPAKRVLVAETHQESPDKFPSAPEKTNDDRTTLQRRRQPSAEPTVPGIASSIFAKPHAAPTTTHASTRLPFPIVASKIAKPESQASGADKASASRTPSKEASDQRLTNANATPSTLRQPPARVHSKIPRVGKPYARPAPAQTGAGSKNASSTSRITASGSTPAATSRKKVEPQSNHAAGHTATTVSFNLVDPGFFLLRELTIIPCRLAQSVCARSSVQSLSLSIRMTAMTSRLLLKLVPGRRQLRIEPWRNTPLQALYLLHRLSASATLVLLTRSTLLLGLALLSCCGKLCLTASRTARRMGSRPLQRLAHRRSPVRHERRGQVRQRRLLALWRVRRRRRHLDSAFRCAKS